MAIFGRRQPHAPLVLRGLPTPGPSLARIVTPRGQDVAQTAALSRRQQNRFIVRTLIQYQPAAAPPVGVVVVPRWQLASQAAAFAPRRPAGHVTIIRGGGPKIAGSTVAPRGQLTAQASVLASHRPNGHITVAKGGGQPATNATVSPRGQFAAQQSGLAARRPNGRVSIVRAGGQPAVNVIVSPRGQLTAQAAALAARRPKGNVSVVRGGGQPAAGKTVLFGQRTARDAANSAHRPLFQPIIRTLLRYAPPVPTVPIGAVVTPRGQLNALLAALSPRRPSGRITVNRAGGPKGVGQTVLFGQRTAQAATAFAHRPLFRPIVLGLLAYQPFTVPPVGAVIVPRGQLAAQLAALAPRRPAGRIIVVRGSGAKEAAQTLLFGQRTSRDAVNLARRVVGKVEIGRGGGPSIPIARTAVFGQRTSRDATNFAHRPLFRPIQRGLLAYAPPVPQPPIGSIVSPRGERSSRDAALRFRRPLFRPIFKTSILPVQPVPPTPPFYITWRGVTNLAVPWTGVTNRVVTWDGL